MNLLNFISPLPLLFALGQKRRTQFYSSWWYKSWSNSAHDYMHDLTRGLWSCAFVKFSLRLESFRVVLSGIGGGFEFHGCCSLLGEAIVPTDVTPNHVTPHYNFEKCALIWLRVRTLNFAFHLLQYTLFSWSCIGMLETDFIIRCL